MIQCKPVETYQKEHHRNHKKDKEKEKKRNPFATIFSITRKEKMYTTNEKESAITKQTKEKTQTKINLPINCPNHNSIKKNIQTKSKQNNEIE